MGIARESEGTPEERWENIIKRMKRLPIMFRLTHIPVIGKYLFPKYFVGDPTARNWVIPVSESVSTDMANVHLPFDIIKPLIEKSAYRSIAAKCVCRSSFECKEYPHEIGSLALGSGLKGLEENGLEPITKEEALAHVEKAINLGLVPTIIWDQDSEFGGADRSKGVVVCLCCDCCCDIRLGLRMGTDAFKKKVVRPEGVSVIVSDECQLCGDCAEPEVCSVRAIHLGPEKSIIDLDLCVGCGKCIGVCPDQAISFVFDPELDIVGSLISQVESYTDIT
jgi:ferredoxin